MKCTLVCPQTYYGDEYDDKRLCKKCDSKCELCYGPGNTKCQKCISPNLLNISTCDTTCP